MTLSLGEGDEEVLNFVRAKLPLFLDWEDPNSPACRSMASRSMEGGLAGVPRPAESTASRSQVWLLRRNATVWPLT